MNSVTNLGGGLSFYRWQRGLAHGLTFTAEMARLTAWLSLLTVDVSLRPATETNLAEVLQERTPPSGVAASHPTNHKAAIPASSKSSASDVDLLKRLITAAKGADATPLSFNPPHGAQATFADYTLETASLLHHAAYTTSHAQLINRHSAASAWFAPLADYDLPALQTAHTHATSDAYAKPSPAVNTTPAPDQPAPFVLVEGQPMPALEIDSEDYIARLTEMMQRIMTDEARRYGLDV
ncbi:MAG: hypothetical protein OHK0046_42000 [Anaerolineae bacterium]